MQEALVKYDYSYFFLVRVFFSFSCRTRVLDVVLVKVNPVPELRLLGQ